MSSSRSAVSDGRPPRRRVPLSARAGLLLAGLQLCSLACSVRSTGPTEVGVRTHRLLGNGIEPRIYPPGGTFLFLPGLSDFTAFDVSLQNLMLSSGADGPLTFKTLDGSDIEVSVTISWRIEPKQAPRLLGAVGATTQQVRDRLVRPLCRSLVRDVFNDLRAEEYYVSTLRFAKAEQARARLTAELLPEGVLVEQVLLGPHHFSAEYEAVLQARKLAEQKKERLRSETIAAQAAQQRDLEQARGQARIEITQARGEAAQLRISAERQLYERDREARATLAERTAAAAALGELRRAMAGPGGRTAVKLRVAEALTDKAVLIVPPATRTALQQLDLNQLYELVSRPPPPEPGDLKAAGSGGGAR